MKRQYVVRVVQTENEDETVDNGRDDYLGRFVECLRYAGLVIVHETDPHGLTTLCFDILPPANRIKDSKKWSEENAERMVSFGYNAVSAPGTEEPPDVTFSVY